MIIIITIFFHNCLTLHTSLKDAQRPNQNPAILPLFKKASTKTKKTCCIYRSREIKADAKGNFNRSYNLYTQGIPKEDLWFRDDV